MSELTERTSGTHARQPDQADLFAGLETGEGSLLLSKFAEAPGEPLSFLRSYVLPAVATVLATYGVLLLVSALTLPTFAGDPGNPEHPLKLPFLADVNVCFMFVVTLPVIVTLLLTERAVIPARLSRIVRGGALETRRGKAPALCRAWRRRYRKVNRVGQLVGLLVAAGVGILNYADFTTGGASWQSTGDDVYLSGWLYTAVYVPLFYWIGVQYLVRSLATSCMLRSVVSRSRLHLKPFHEDRCGGLKAIGDLGLRNQPFLLTGVINVLLIVYIFNILDKGGGVLFYLLLAAAAIYILATFLFLLGPVFPFTKVMRLEKKRALRSIAQSLGAEHVTIRKELESHRPECLEFSTMSGLLELRSTVRRMTVWPFGAATRRGSVVVFLGILAFILNVARNMLQGWIESNVL